MNELTIQSFYSEKVKENFIQFTYVGEQGREYQTAISVSTFMSELNKGAFIIPMQEK